MAEDRGRNRGDRDNRGTDRGYGRGNGRGAGHGGERGKGAGRRDARAREAEQHIKEMGARFSKEIAASVAGIKSYDGMPKAKQAAKAKQVVEAAAGEPAAAVVTESADASAPVEPAAAVEPAAPADAPAGEAGEGAAAVEQSEPAADQPEPATEQPEPAAEPAPALPQVTVVAQDSVAAIVEHGRGRAQFCDLAVLDFASFRYAGGGYDRGAWAQEEALCADSFLYNALATQKAWYAENRRRNVNCELYRNRGLVVPAVRFARGKFHAYADVIVVAAPNARRAREDYGVKDATLVDAMRDRIRFALAIADDLGREKLVLGAFGCGVFGWDAEQVAELFREELARGSHAAKQVIFAVPETRYDENLPKFQHVFGAFPEVPSSTYAEAKAAHATAAAAAASAEDDDEDEEDWRKYLG